jgi:hypothetical protein
MNDEIFEIENIIPIDYQNHLLATMTGFSFPWAFNPSLVSPDDIFLDRDDNHAGFNHFFYEKGEPTSQFFNLLYPLVLSITSQSPIKFNRMTRMRANLTLQNKTSKSEYHMPHIDTWFPHWNAIYYVNDCDGDTFIFNEMNENYDPGEGDINKIKDMQFTVKRRITPKKGKIVIFPGKYYHASSYTQQSRYRCVVNINLENLFS